jgi:MtN3 and saliva related transmembrane protein
MYRDQIVAGVLLRHFGVGPTGPAFAGPMLPHAAVIKLQVIRLYCGLMNGLLVDSIGMTGAVLTTVCWLPQAIQIVRSRDTAAISLSGTLAFTIGIAFWLIYGLALMDWPLITSNVVTLALMSVIVALKLRHG